jgi:hypothetical protein
LEFHLRTTCKNQVAWMFLNFCTYLMLYF